MVTSKKYFFNAELLCEEGVTSRKDFLCEEAVINRKDFTMQNCSVEMLQAGKILKCRTAL
jgi:hypothetical protein